MAASKRSAGARKKSRAKSGGSTKTARGGAKKRGAAKKGGAKKGGAKKSANRPQIKRSSATRGSAAKKSGAKKSSARKGGAKKGGAKKSGGSKRRSNPVSRVTRVAKEVVQQATTVVTEGVEQLKELGENIVERVTG